MKALLERINRVINTGAFTDHLEANGLDLIEFQCSWVRESRGCFDRLREHFRGAILAGEAELNRAGVVVLA